MNVAIVGATGYGGIQAVNLLKKNKNYNISFLGGNKTSGSKWNHNFPFIYLDNDPYIEEISVGDFVMSGGEYPAICLIDAIARNLPGTVGNEDSVKNDSFSNGLLKGPAYTRPEIFEDDQVPDVLLSGNHSRISEWKANKSLIQTYLRRPDLINKVKLTKKQKKLLEELESKDIL